MPSSETPERRWAMTKIAAGDWLLPSNDTRWLWRFTKTIDGPSLGLADWPADREVWWIRRTPFRDADDTFPVIARSNVDDHPWTDVMSWLPTRQACIDYAMEREGS